MKTFTITITGDCPDNVPDAIILRAASEVALPVLQPLDWAGYEFLATNVVTDVNITSDAEPQKSAQKKNSAGYEVHLTDSGPKKIQVIKEVRSLTNLGLKEAKDLVDNTPSVILDNLSYAEALRARNALEVEGATVRVV